MVIYRIRSKCPLIDRKPIFFYLDAREFPPNTLLGRQNVMFCSSVLNKNNKRMQKPTQFLPVFVNSWHAG